MNDTASEVLHFVEENDVKFVRLAFTDIFGTMKNISIMADELPRALEDGITFDASAVPGFMNVEESDLFLCPDPGTLAVLPWRPQQGRVVRLLCDIRHPDGSVFEGDGRSVLKKAQEKAAGLGLCCQIGAECEFYLFEADEDGRPTTKPMDRGGYLDVAPADKGENVRREICFTLEDMGIKPESSRHEQGPGQNVIDFRYSDALTAADNVVTFKTVVRTVAAANGLFASFMPKPIWNMSGNGLHVNMSLFRNGQNIFKSSAQEHCQEAESFIAGVLRRIREITAFLNPITNSYARVGKFEAPKYVTWSHQNRSQLIRIPAAKGDKVRMELRSPDPVCNPYFAFALLIHAGLEGIEQQLPLCPPANVNLYSAPAQVLQGVESLPATLEEAVGLAQSSEFVKSTLPNKTIQKYWERQLALCDKYARAVDKDAFEHAQYFNDV